MKSLIIVFILSFVGISSVQAQCTQAPNINRYYIDATYCNSFVYLQSFSSLTEDPLTWYYFEVYGEDDVSFNNPIVVDSTQKTRFDYSDNFRFNLEYQNYLIRIYGKNPCGASDTVEISNYFALNTESSICGPGQYSIEGDTVYCQNIPGKEYKLSSGDLPTNTLINGPLGADSITWALNGVEYIFQGQTFTVPELTQEINTLIVYSASECSCSGLDNYKGNRNEIARLTIIADDCSNQPCVEAPVMDSTEISSFFIRSLGTCNDIDNKLSYIATTSLKNATKAGPFNMVIELFDLSDTDFSNPLSKSTFPQQLEIEELIQVKLIDNLTSYKGRLYIENECGISTSIYSGILNEKPLFDLNSDTCNNHFNTIDGEDYYCSNFSNTSYTLQGDNFSRNNVDFNLSWYLNNSKISGNSRTTNISNLQPGNNLLEARITSPCQCGSLDFSNSLTKTIADKIIFLDTLCGNKTLMGIVSGIADDDCLNPNTAPLKNVVVEVNDGLFRTITDSTGKYTFQLPEGDYTLNAIVPSKNDDLCDFDSNITLISDTSININMRLNENAYIYTYLRSTRPGGKFSGYMYVKNTSGLAMENARINITYSGPISQFISTPAWTSINANTVSIEGVNIAPYSTFLIDFNAITDSTANIGNIIQIETQLITSRKIFNGSAHSIVRNSYDPNDKTVNKPKVDITEIGDRLDYTIRFQNTGNAPALKVVVTDTLESKLNISSLQIGPASHPFEVNFSDKNILRWTFDNINLPDSTSDFDGSQGFLTFSINMKQNVQLGDEILNSANIYFDFNPPIITNKASVKIMNLTSVIENSLINAKLYPNPTTGLIYIESDISLSRVIVFSVQGSKLLEFHEPPVTSIDLRSLKPGIYHIQLVDGQHNSFIQRIVKN